MAGFEPWHLRSRVDCVTSVLLMLADLTNIQFKILGEKIININIILILKAVIFNFKIKIFKYEHDL